MADIFISFIHEDEKVAGGVKGGLERNSLTLRLYIC